VSSASFLCSKSALEHTSELHLFKLIKLQCLGQDTKALIASSCVRNDRKKKLLNCLRNG
jgi:hypothetical protein